MTGRETSVWGWLGLALAIGCFAALLFCRLGYPLLWQDEGETAMFARRVLEYGYPKVHGERNVVYQFGFDVAQGVKERHDAYIGTTWGHFYFAAPGVALADRTDDLRLKTVWMRLPFALAGSAGVGVALLGVLPAVRGRSRKLGLAATHFALAAVCISLILHLREVRYYALTTLLASSIFAVYAGRTAWHRVGYRSWAVATAFLLFLVYHTFFAGFVVLTAAVALDRLAESRLLAPQQRSRFLGWELAPLSAAGVAIAPFVVYFEQIQTARAFSQNLTTAPSYVQNLAAALVYLARFEFLVPAVGFAALGIVCSRGSAERSVESDPTWPARRFLWILVAVTPLIHGFNPLVFGRYFVFMAPLGIALTLLEGVRTARLAGGRPAFMLLGVLVLAAGVVPKARDVARRIGELREPALGPLDFAIPFLAERYDDTRGLVIATNYEAFSVMTYLRSHVIVGMSGANLARDRMLEPDVLLPRKMWPNLDVLAGFYRRGRFEGHTLPVADVAVNTIPELGDWPAVPLRHPFKTRRPASDAQALEILLRVDKDTAPRSP